MRNRTHWPAGAACLSAVSIAAGGLPMPDHPMFTTDQVQEIHITFYDPDYWDILEANYEDEIYLEASFDWGNVHFDTVGVRFKGGSSYLTNPTMKKSFKIDLDQFVPEQEVYGVNKINLNCNYDDPSFVREIACYELCEEAGLPSLRRGFAALYINDTYWGLYTLVEQLNSAYIEQCFGPSEDGNLWKGDNYGTLEYLGSQQEDYYPCYELKTNETANDWSDLIQFTYLLNSTPAEALPDTLSGTMDLGTALGLLAVDNLTVNLDSYVGRCANYYLYHMDRDDRFYFSNWDLNEAWGVFNQWNLSTGELETLDPYWTSTVPGESRPLAELLWNVDDYSEVYIGYLQKLMAGAGHQDSLVCRMEELRDVASDWVYMEQEPRRLFSPYQFEVAMDQEVQIGPGRFAPALETFVRNRDDYLRNLIGAWVPVENIVLNELMARNDTTIQDDYGEYDDWVEITNTGSVEMNMDGFYLTDDMAFPFKFEFPDTILQPGEYILVWADDDSYQGPMHADFKLDGDGEEVYLLQGAVVVDQVTFPGLDEDVSYGRYPDGAGDWEILGTATPMEPNQGGTGLIPDFQQEEQSLQELCIICPSPASGSVPVMLTGEDGAARLDVYDMTGRLMDTPYEGYLYGSVTFTWDAAAYPEGVYFLNMLQGNISEVLKVVVVR